MSTGIERTNKEKFERAVALHQNGHLAQAGSLYEEILRSQPAHSNAAFFLGLSHAQRNNLGLAAKFFGTAAKLDPAFVDAHFNCGLAFHSLGQFQEALENYERAIRLKADHAVALHNRAIILCALGRRDEALRNFDKAISVSRDYAEAYCNRGVVLVALRHLDEALSSYDRAIELKSDYVEAYCNRGVALGELKRFDEALRDSDRAIRLKPDYADAHFNRSSMLIAMKRFEEALQSCDRAIRLKPDYADAYTNRGTALAALNRFEKALESYNRALAVKADLADAWCGLGNVLSELKRYDESLTAYGKALESKPGLANAWHGRGNVLSRLNRHDQAASAYAKVLEIEPQYEFMKGLLLHEKMLSCDWRGIEYLIEEIEGDMAIGRPSADPFGWQGIAKSDRSLQLCAELHTAKRFPAALGCSARPSFDNNKIRIGYSSGEFRQQATAFLLAGVLEQHDKSRFEIYAVDNGWDDLERNAEANLQLRTKSIDIRSLSDAEAAAAVSGNQIDILVNLNGYFGEARMGVFAQRPVPIQVNYLGFPGTLGASYVDYIIADRHVIPEDRKAYFTEKVVYLPDCYQANDGNREISTREFSRAELDLPETGFVFCCFNNNYKILPDIFDIWMRILECVSGSVLWLLEDNAIAAHNLREEAMARGVNAERLIFAKRLPLPEHLARHRCADLFLDTLPHNAHTTASDALWAGLPVLTCVGNTFAGRVAASLLNAVDLRELITTSLEEYERVAIELATHPAKLASLKRKLAANRLTTPLFDTALFTRHIEAAYTTMVERYRADLTPDHIEVRRL